MVTTIERAGGHYEVREVEFGRVYRWCPECLIAECECGERFTLTSSVTTCGGCGADHTVVVSEELAARRLRDDALHPWRSAGNREDIGLPY